MKKLFAKKGIKFNPKSIYLALVFVLAIALSSSATFSFAKYKYQESIDRPANIALGVVDYERGSLIRNKGKVDELIYSVDDREVVFVDIEPQDVIEYTFSINNFIQERGNNQINEVLMEVEVYFRVYLKRLAVQQALDDSGDVSYFIVETDYAVEETPDHLNMKGASITFSKRDNANNKYDTVSKIAEGTYNTTPAAGVYVNDDKVHNYRFYMVPGEGAVQNTFQLNIVLPQQSVDAAQTIAGRLYIEVGYKAEQKLQIS